MLKGFTVPKSPFGQAALTPPPPWHYSSDVVGVEFWTDPEATAATLPSGLSPDPKSNGHAVIMFLDWQFTAQDDEFLDPARYQYREAFVLLDAMYRDTPRDVVPLHLCRQRCRAGARVGRKAFPRKWVAFSRRAHLPRRALPPHQLCPVADLARAFPRTASDWRKPASPCGSLSKMDYRSSAARRSCCDTSRGLPPDIRTSRRSMSWRCRSPTISPSPTHGSGRAN